MKTDFFVPEHEANLLALLMRDEDKVHDALGNLRSSVFNAGLNILICDAIFEVARQGITPTSDVVKAYMEHKKTLDAAGGEDYFNKIAGTDVDPGAFSIYYDSVMDAYKRREVSRLSQTMSSAVHNADDISDFISGTQAQLSNLNGANLHGGVRTIEELLISAFDIIKTRREGGSGDLVGITTGFPTIDEVTGGYIGGDLWIFGGRPSQGKTTALIQSFMNASEQADAGCLLFSREMGPMELMFRMLAMDRKVPHQQIKTGQLSETNYTKIQQGQRKLSKLPIYLDSNYYGDINYITSSIRKYHKLYDVKLVGIDYVQLLAERGGDQVAELGRISRELKLLALDLDITVVLLSQLNRKVEDREDRRPILSDLRQSGNLEEDADVVIGLFRDEYYNVNSPHAGKVDFIILKQRNGPTGVFTLRFEAKYLRIVDVHGDIEFGGDDE